MTAIAVDKETSNYWEMIKGASNKAKLTLMALISASMVDDEIITTRQKPVKAHRLSAMTDEEMELEMQGDATALSGEDEGALSEIVEANRGRIVKGLEKWL